MAVVAPMPLSTHSQSSYNHFHHSSSRRNSDMALVGRSSSSGNTSLSASPSRGRQPLMTLEDIAAQIQNSLKLSTSPSSDFSYLDDKVYGAGNSIPRFKSRSLPNINHDRLKSSLSPKVPLRKIKSVRFADSQGLPLVEAVHQLTHKDSSYTENKIVPYDEQEDILSDKPLIAAAPEMVPKSASDDMKSGQPRLPKPPSSLPARNNSPRTPGRQNNSPIQHSVHKHTFTFTQPSLEPDFFERVKRDNVVLESIREEPRSVHGIVRVFNLAYSKEVNIRWTHDRWRTSHETSSVFCSNDGDTDRFAFELPINGDDVSFAIRYRVGGEEYWDNNRGADYTVTSRS